MLNNYMKYMFLTKYLISCKQLNILEICYIHAVDMHNNYLCVEL